MRPKAFPHLMNIVAALILMAGALVAATEVAQAQTLGGFSTIGSLPAALSGARATVLANGDVLVCGGTTGSPSSPVPATVAQVYDPTKGTWAATGNLPTPVYDATSTLLADGDVLVAGGLTAGSSPHAATSAAQVFDPSTNNWSTTGSMATASFGAAAERLANGDVLVAGGDTGTSEAATSTSATALFDPATGKWSALAMLPQAVAFAQVAELSVGDVLVAGGVADSGGAPGGGAASKSVQLYDPTDGSWHAEAPLATATYGAAATLLADGRVLIAGGLSSSTTLSSSGEVYNQSANSWSPTGAMAVAVYDGSTARLAGGDVLVAGGAGSGGGALAQAELYDPTANTWTATGALPVATKSAAAALLASGEVLVAGGTNTSGAFSASAALYVVASPVSIAPTGVADFTVGQYGSTTISATSSPVPQLTETGMLPPGLVFSNAGNGRATISGTPGAAGTFPVEIVASNGTGASASEQLTIVVSAGAAPVHADVPGTFNGASSLPVPVAGATATALPNGDVLVAGGYTGTPTAPTPSAGAWLYVPSSRAWASAGSLPVARYDATATLLANGTVLVAGGLTGGYPSSATSSAEIYNPANNTWTATQAMLVARFGAVARRLPNGDVLVAGGDTGSAGDASNTSSAELYEPATGSWAATSSLPYPTAFAQVATLQNGDILVNGGVSDYYTAAGSGPATGATKTYDPATGAWSLSTSSGAGRYDATAVVLANGKVLLAGGRSSASAPLSSAEVYNPANGQWSGTGSLPVASFDAASALLADGDVLVAGGANAAGNALATAQLYSPSNGYWALTGPLEVATAGAAVARLADGDVLVAGGRTTPSALTAAAEVYAAGSQTAPAIAPIGAAHFRVNVPGTLTITATGNPVPTLSEAGTLPTGLVFTSGPNGTATISGRAVQAGTYGVQVVATNGVGTKASMTVTIVVAPAPVVNPKPVLVAVVSSSRGHGYYLVSSAGNVYNHGGAPFYGSTARLHLPAPVSGFALTSDGKGYWLADRAGDVYAFGDARVYSSLHVNTTARPVVAIVSSPSGHGYYLVTSKGNVFNRGDAHFYGSKASSFLAHPIVAAALAKGGRGYYLVGSGGNVYHFGPAPFYGFRATYQLGAPITGFAVTRNGNGYYLVSAKGNIYNFGGAHFYGSTAIRHLPAPVSGVALTPDGKGYWLGDQAGDVYAFGDAQA